MSEKTKELLSSYVCFLRALYFIHQNHHWITGGMNFYSNHQLFERIYQSAQKDSDAAAEKVIGVFGKDFLDLSKQAEIFSKILSKLKPIENEVKLSLDVEKRFLMFSTQVYNYLKENDQLTLGLDDLIMSIHSSREEAVYLLSQLEIK